MTNKHDWRRDLGMSWRRRVTNFWEAYVTIVTLGTVKL